MKKLAVFFTCRQCIPADRSGRIHWLSLLALALLAVIFCFSSYQLNRIIDKTSFEAAVEKNAIALDLSSEAVIKLLGSMRHSISLVARQPVLREMQNGNTARSFAYETGENLRLLILSYEVNLSEMFRIFLDYENTAAYLNEVPDAAARTLFSLPALFAGEMVGASDESFLINKKAAAQNHSLRSQLTERLLEKVSKIWVSALNFFIPAAEAVESLIGFKKEELRNPLAAESLLAGALIDDLIRGFVLKSFSGEPLLKVGNKIVNTIISDQRDCQAVANGTSFFSGPVAHDRNTGKTLWWIAVPVRNKQREPVACLSAVVDLGFLSEISENLYNDHKVKAVFIDRRGFVIGSNASEELGSQIDHNNQIPEINDSAVVNRKIRKNSLMIIQGGRTIKNGLVRFLPDWKIICETQIQLLSGKEQIFISLCVFLLAAAGMYAISCCFVQTLKFLNGD